MYERIRMINRPYFTNTDQMNKSDPYHILDLQWGVGSDDKLESEIKAAFRRKARMLHPDVNKTDTPEKALHKFQQLQKAYSNLMDVKGSHRDDLAEEWSFAVWRHGDIMSQERTDVAGHARKRPVKPAVSARNKAWGVASLGHPDGKSGNGSRRRGEYLAEGCSDDDGTTANQGGPRSRSSTVGTGQSKWVKKKEYKPWRPKPD